GPAGEGRGLVDVDAGVAATRAVIGGVVVARSALRGAGAARRTRGEPVRRARARRARASLGDVALARRSPAGEGGRPEDVDARVTATRAVIGGVVVARSALRGAGAARRTRGEPVRRARARRARASLGDVALARRSPAGEGGR